jgi:hypothetical protein
MKNMHSNICIVIIRIMETGTRQCEGLLLSNLDRLCDGTIKDCINKIKIEHPLSLI